MGARDGSPVLLGTVNSVINIMIHALVTVAAIGIARAAGRV
jgi:hypothetical protein